MTLSLSPEQRATEERCATLVDEQVVPRASAIDREEHLPRELVESVAAEGWLGMHLGAEWGGGQGDMVSVGLVHQQLGRGCSSLRSLATVHTMASHAIERFGAPALRERWLPALAAGDKLVAFALTEPEAGSDAGSIAASATRSGDTYRLVGKKRWVTAGQIADVMVVFARAEEGPIALVVETDSPGVERRPIRGMLGTRGSMLAEVDFDCEVPAASTLARPGLGISHVATLALALGRFSVAWGCLGIQQACLRAATDRARARHQFGVPLSDHQLVRRHLTNLWTDYRASRSLCWEVATAGTKATGWLSDTFVAKYQAAGAAMRAAHTAVQLHGAVGCSGDSPVERYMRDAKVMEIIEGSTEIQQVTIADFALRARLP